MWKRPAVEGTAAQMRASLARLAALPEACKVYCGHKYTLANLRFALEAEPLSKALQEGETSAREVRANGHPTPPSTIGQERATNPVLRWDVAAVRSAAQRQTPGASISAVATFAALRSWKDRF